MKSKPLSMKKLYQWAAEYPEWKKREENNKGTSDHAINIGVMWISDYLQMLWEKRREEVEK